MDRYIVLVGGAAFFNITGVDGKQRPYPARPYRIKDGTCNITEDVDPSKSGIEYWGYNNAVLVFDVEKSEWGTIEAISKDPELLGPDGECGPFPR